jgi:hypothetical protein
MKEIIAGAADAEVVELVMAVVQRCTCSIGRAGWAIEGNIA